ncbi:PREDICTED: etoposide-induced protein 2.4 homolog [Acropora digitifera]|uniref:etoposide-induced protein 2.4 homolog n=1 Tax=Acropora digitifera TaxID=70779 RepID=UPI00077AC06A|nr:PREDICTED: etoposide-induced protein 2.4 homolog [Acropora digitifera]
MSDFRAIVLGFVCGFKDSVVGMTALLRLRSILEENQMEKQKMDMYSSRRIRDRRQADRKAKSSVCMKEILSKILQCCVLNGGIFWMSIFLFENYIIPGLQICTQLIFNILSGAAPHQSLWLWRWMGPFLSYLFSALWVLPLYWLSKPLNSLYYQEIADSAYRNVRGRPLAFLTTFSNERWGLYNDNIELKKKNWFLCFVFQAMLVSFIPVVGPTLGFCHMCLLYSLYTFEYKWVNMGWTAPKRLSYVESNWPYFVGFGLPMAALTSLAPTFIIRSV